MLESLADLLHVERATRRGHVHSTRFLDLEEQRAWLEEMAKRQWGASARYMRLLETASLEQLRAGQLGAS